MIPFNRPTQTGGELERIAASLSAARLSGDGPFCHRSERLLESAVGVRRALLTTSCTHALEMAALLLDVKAGDEVIVPSFTFVSTINAFALRGARPVFCDVRADTLNLDERKVDALVTPKTRAIVPVHYAGVGCEMDSLEEIGRRHDVAIVEDNAHGLFGRYRGRPLGSIGAMATQSFHETKNLTCGEGGALLLRDERFIERAEILREKGTNRSRFFRGQVDKYSWVDLGSSYVLSDILAAYLSVQLERAAEIQASRKAVWERYEAGLGAWADANGVRLPVVPPHCEQAYHMFYVLLPSLAARQALIAHLKQAEMYAVFHYLPLHLSEMGTKYGGRVGDCPVTEDVSDRLLRLPFFTSMDAAEQSRLIDRITSFRTP